MEKKLSGKVALVTGASRGIGGAIALRYAQEGAHVILVARTTGGLEAVDDALKHLGGQSTLVPMDITKFDQIDQLGGVIAERFGRLDILVGNAAILGVLSPLAHTPPDVWEKVLATNLTANYRLLRSFDALLKQSLAARVIFVTSAVAREDIPYWGGYAISKAALEKMVRMYAHEIEMCSIRANIVDPGVVRTNMRKQAMPGEQANNLPGPDQVTDIFVTLAMESCSDNGKMFAVR